MPCSQHNTPKVVTPLFRDTYSLYFASVILLQVLAFLWTCLFCFLAKRVSLAIGVIKEAGRSIAAMPLIVLWPLVELVRANNFQQRRVGKWGLARRVGRWEGGICAYAHVHALNRARVEPQDQAGSCLARWSLFDMPF